MSPSRSTSAASAPNRAAKALATANATAKAIAKATANAIANVSARAIANALGALVAIVVIGAAAGCAPSGGGARDSAAGHAEGQAAARGTAATAAAQAAADTALDSGPIDLVDDIGDTVHLAHPARRVVSLIPSATETLIAIGATGAIVGRTRYDTASALAGVTSVGGGIDPSIETIVRLAPDLVVGWTSDRRAGLRARLQSLGIQTFVMSTEDTTDIFRNLANLGRLTGREAPASAVAASVHAALDSVRRAVAGRPSPSVVYVVFPDPPMTVGPKSFIGQLLALAGARSIFPNADRNWPNVPMEEIVRRDPDIVIVPVGDLEDSALERFRKLPGWRDLRAVKEGRVVSVSADLLSRPSPAIARSAAVLGRAVHPELGAPSDPSRRR